MFVLHVDILKLALCSHADLAVKKKPTEGCKLWKFCEILRKQTEENNDGF